MATQPVAFGALLLVTAVLLLPIREQQVATGSSTTRGNIAEVLRECNVRLEIRGDSEPDLRLLALERARS